MQVYAESTSAKDVRFVVQSLNLKRQEALNDFEDSEPSIAEPSDCQIQDQENVAQIPWSEFDDVSHGDNLALNLILI